MKSRTKHILAPEKVVALAQKHFPGVTVTGVQELKGGMFNAVYTLQCTGGEQDTLVLKVGPAPGTPTLTYEKDILRTEVEIYSLLPRDLIPAPRVLAADYQRDIIPSDCFFMEHVPGAPWSSLANKAKPHRPALMQELGRCNAAVHSIGGESFGYPKADAHYRHATWSAAFHCMVEDMLTDGERRKCRLPYDTIRKTMQKHTALLDEITKPVLVDYDMWAGNIFLKPQGAGYTISGVMDFERAFYGDPTADFTAAMMLFSDVEAEPDFIKGYEAVSGKPLVITEGDHARMDLYRLYMALIMNVETYRYNAAYAALIKSYTTGQVKKLLRKL